MTIEPLIQPPRYARPLMTAVCALLLVGSFGAAAWYLLRVTDLENAGPADILPALAIPLLIWVCKLAVDGLAHGLSGGQPAFVKAGELILHTPLRCSVRVADLDDIVLTSFRNWPFPRQTCLRILRKNGSGMDIPPIYFHRKPEVARDILLAIARS